MDDRLEYYKKKYGESFAVKKAEPTDSGKDDGKSQRNAGLLAKIFKKDKKK